MNINWNFENTYYFAGIVSALVIIGLYLVVKGGVKRQ